MKNHFVFGYAGNKRDEVGDIYDSFDLTNIDTIVEPFCGTSAVSYYISTLHPQKYKYVLNDLNKNLFDLYNILRDKTKLIEFEKLINEKAKRIVDKKTYNEEIKNYKTNICDWFISCKIYAIRQGLYKNGYKYTYIDLKKCPIVEFLQTENVEIRNVEGVEILQEYNKKNCLIFVDPPYLLSCNEYYDDAKSKSQNVYEYIYNNNIKKMKNKFVMVVEKNWMISLLFQKITNIIEYSKLYQTTKRVTKHLIIRNYKTI